MPSDPLTQKLLIEFKRNAEALENGDNLSPETMAKYLGKMGSLLCHCVENMWSDDMLNQRVTDLIEDRCKSCPNTAYIELMKRGIVRDTEVVVDHGHEHARHAEAATDDSAPRITWGFVIREYGKTLIWAVASVVIAAIIFGQLPTLGEFFHNIRQETHEVTK